MGHKTEYLWAGITGEGLLGRRNLIEFYESVLENGNVFIEVIRRRATGKSRNLCLIGFEQVGGLIGEIIDGEKRESVKYAGVRAAITLSTFSTFLYSFL